MDGRSSTLWMTIQRPFERPFIESLNICSSARADIIAEAEDDAEIAQSVVESMLEDKRKALAKAEKAKPAEGATIAEKIAAQKAHKAAIEKAKADVAFWENVAQQKDVVATEEVAEQSEEKRLYDTVGGSPVALAYLLEGGEGSIENAGYFLHGVAAAFPAVTNEIEDARHAMGGDILGMAPLDFVEQCPNEVDAVRQIIERAYGEAGVAVYEKLLANASGFYPRAGAVVEAEIENLKPITDKQGQQVEIQESEEVDEFGNHFVLASNGSSEFGIVDAESGLKYAPIKLSMGENTVDENGNNHGYGLLHIEAQRGEAIRNAGYSSVQEFVESVAKNYTDIREGGVIANNQTYLLELVDEHNNTLFIQLSRNGEYWTINSAGIFRRKYSRNKRKVYDRPALGSDTNTDTSGVDSGQIKGVTTPAGNSPQTSTGKDRADVSNVQENVQENSAQHFVNRIAEEWSAKIGVPVQVVESLDEVVNDQVRAAIENGVAVEGWYEPSTGRVCIYKPNFSTEQRVSEVIIHEAVAHKGLVGLLGQKAFDALCDQVWAMMPQSARDEYENYPGVKGIEDEVARHRAAADEYIAHLAEQTDLTDAEQTIWDSVIAALRKLLESAGINLKMSDADLSNLVKASYAKMAKEAKERKQAEAIAQNANGAARMMGTRVDKRMADIAQHFDGAELSETQSAIVDVFGGKGNNLPISVNRADGSSRRVVMRQGTENKAGAKHSLFRHYGTNSGAYTADELLLIEDVLVNGERTEEQRRGITVNVYKHTIDGVEYTVLTETNNRGTEVFANFYTNRNDNARSSNTQLSAQADSITASTGKGTNNSQTTQGNGAKMSVAEQQATEKAIAAMENSELGQALMPTEEAIEVAELAAAEEKVANAKGVAELADAIAERERVKFAAKRYGGNSGYVGYSKSKRAVDAEERGLRNASQMNAEFANEVNQIIEERTGAPSKLTLKAIKAALPNIPADEWHHTSMYGNKTNYYSAERVASHFAKDPELEAKDKAELEAAKRYDAYAAAVRSRIPMMKIETTLGEEDAFITSEGYAVEVPKNVVNNPEGARLFAIGELTGEEPYVVDKFSDWAYKNREQFKAAVQEYVDAVQKAKEEVEQSGVKFAVKPLVGNKKLHEGLRELEEGETSLVERVFTENKNFEFSSKNTIKSYNDVAYIFKELENESIENAFAVLVKGGRPTVVHLGMGSFTQTILSGAALNVAVRRIQPEKIYFVHNHPSGTLKSSIQDNNVLRNWKAAFGEDIVQEGIIIDSFSGKYGIFGGVGNLEYDMPSEQGDERPIKVYSFSKQIYQKDFKPSGQLTSSEDVAAFITSQRLGDRPKLGLLIANNQLQITGNVFLPYSEVTNKNADAIANDIAYYTTVLGGNRAFLFGNVSIKDVEGKNISNGVNAYSQGEINLLDFIEIDGGRYKSANDEGVRFSAKRKASKTALPEDESSFKGTVISDADRAKVLKNLDTLQKEYENKSAKDVKTFIGDLSEALNLRNNGNNSNYGDYVAVNGKEVTIRVSDHNVSVKDMDDAGKVNGISIVVSRKPNEGVRDYGDSHIVEFFYNDKKLRNSVGQPFVEIINSLKQTVYSGEYQDTTGIAEREEVNSILEENSAEQEDLTNQPTRLSVAQQKVDNAKSIAELADAIAEREQIKREARFAVRSGRSLRDEYDRLTRRPTKNNDVRWYSNFFRRMAESYQDSMHALNVLQDLVAEETGKPIEGFENAYWAENRMSSMNKAQQEAYERDFITPLYAEIDKLQKAGASYQEILDYLFAKHGLERNEVFAQREGKVRDYSGLSALT